MASHGMSKSTKIVWTVLVVLLTGVFAFAGGYLVGTTMSEADEGLTVVDDYGRTVTLNGIPQRIVSIA